jgi:excisionase family DNA binding protein
MGFQALRVLDHPHPPLTSSEWQVRVVDPTPGQVLQAAGRATAENEVDGVEPESSSNRAHADMSTEPDTQQPEHLSVALDTPLLTAEQVAQLLAVPRSSVYEYARRQHDPLPSIAVGRHRRFHRTEIERWLATYANHLQRAAV